MDDDNHSGAKIETRQAQNGRDLEIIVSELMARDVSNKGPHIRTIQQQFALTRQGVGC